MAAANTGKINMELVVSDKGSVTVKRATSKITGHLRKMGTRVSGIIKKFVSWRMAVVALAGAAAMGLLIKKVIALAAAQELAEKKLEQAMISTGVWNVNLMESYKRYASELQKLTGIGDETILGVMAMLQTFKLQEGTLIDATKATLDLAKATGQDLMSAAILMGKAAVGEVSMLKRYGIIIDEAAYKARGFQAVLDEINTEFGGQAQAQAETYAGKIGKLKSFWGDLLEKVGEFITKNPAMTEAIDKVKDKIIDWTTMLEENGEVVAEWITTSVDFAEKVAKSIASGVMIMVEAWEKLVEVWEKIEPTWEKVKRVMERAAPNQVELMKKSSVELGYVPGDYYGKPVTGGQTGTRATGWTSGDVGSIIAAMQQGGKIKGTPTGGFGQGGYQIINNFTGNMSRSDVVNISQEQSRQIYRGGSPGALSGAGGGY